MNDYNEIIYYIKIAKDNNLSQIQLHEKIKNKEYYRLSLVAREKILNNNKLEVQDLVPNPILIRNRNNIDIANEKVLHDLILDDIKSFMNELGSEYKIKIGDSYHKIDFLLFNYKFNSFVVVEL